MVVDGGIVVAAVEVVVGGTVEVVVVLGAEVDEVVVVEGATLVEVVVDVGTSVVVVAGTVVVDVVGSGCASMYAFAAANPASASGCDGVDCCATVAVTLPARKAPTTARGTTRRRIT